MVRALMFDVSYRHRLAEKDLSRSADVTFILI
jgi:hypothetical protein